MAGRIKEQGIPEGFTLTMAVMDTLPVLFFGITIGVLVRRFDSRLFLAGAFLVILAGALKAGWKFVISLARRDVRFLNRQMRYLMPVGFALMLLGGIVDRDKWSWNEIQAHFMHFPSCLFLLIGMAGIAVMVVLAKKANARDARSNWVEQCVNSLAQLCFLLAIL